VKTPSCCSSNLFSHASILIDRVWSGEVSVGVIVSSVKIDGVRWRAPQPRYGEIDLRGAESSIKISS
jgi:hypothetical protein